MLPPTRQPSPLKRTEEEEGWLDDRETCSRLPDLELRWLKTGFAPYLQWVPPLNVVHAKRRTVDNERWHRTRPALL